MKQKYDFKSLCQCLNLNIQTKTKQHYNKQLLHFTKNYQLNIYEIKYILLVVALDMHEMIKIELLSKRLKLKTVFNQEYFLVKDSTDDSGYFTISWTAKSGGKTSAQNVACTLEYLGY